jgi:hypothetical protein
MLAFARWCTVPTRKFKVGRTVNKYLTLLLF